MPSNATNSPVVRASGNIVGAQLRDGIFHTVCVRFCAMEIEHVVVASYTWVWRIHKAGFRRVPSVYALPGHAHAAPDLLFSSFLWLFETADAAPQADCRMAPLRRGRDGRRRCRRNMSLQSRSRPTMLDGPVVDAGVRASRQAGSERLRADLSDSNLARTMIMHRRILCSLGGGPVFLSAGGNAAMNRSPPVSPLFAPKTRTPPASPAPSGKASRMAATSLALQWAPVATAYVGDLHTATTEVDLFRLFSKARTRGRQADRELPTVHKLSLVDANHGRSVRRRFVGAA